MRSFWITMILVGFVPATEIQHVELGSTATLGCNISYIYDTTWLKHSPDFTPTVVLRASLREGQPFQGHQLSPRFSVMLMNRSLALTITGIEERDLGLYYCIANVNTRLVVGTGTMLRVSSPGASWFVFQHWYCVAVGFGLLIMGLALCIVHWKTSSYKEANHQERH